MIVTFIVLVVIHHQPILVSVHVPGNKKYTNGSSYNKLGDEETGVDLPSVFLQWVLWFFGGNTIQWPLENDTRYHPCPFGCQSNSSLLICLKFYLVSWVPCNKKATCLYIATRDWDTLNICANDEEIGCCMVPFSTRVTDLPPLSFGTSIGSS